MLSLDYCHSLLCSHSTTGILSYALTRLLSFSPCSHSTTVIISYSLTLSYRYPPCPLFCLFVMCVFFFIPLSAVFCVLAIIWLIIVVCLCQINNPNFYHINRSVILDYLIYSKSTGDLESTLVIQRPPYIFWQ